MVANVLGLLDSQTLWYVTRATGVVALVLLTMSVVLGITEAVRWVGEQWPRFITAGLHKNASLLAVAFLAAHIATAVVDGFAPIGWLDAIVPFHSPYRPLWLGLGTVAFDLLLALVATSLLRRRIGPRAWRAVHWFAYACWPIAFVHGLGTGTDTKTSWYFGVELACLAAVVVAVWWRVVSGWSAAPQRRSLAAAAAILAPLVIIGWAYAGPLQPGWARRAGTPAALLGPAASATNGTDAAPADPSGANTADPTPALVPPFDAALTGTIDEPQPDRRGHETITIDAQLAGTVTGALHMVLNGRAIDDGGVSLETSNVTLSGSGNTYAGAVTELRGTLIDAQLTDATGDTLALEVDLVVDGGQVSGRVHGSAA
jgi:sulfoxide reductase heme-binding subunit YedZ